MASLYELINAELEKNKSITYNRLDEFITDDKRCIGWRSRVPVTVRLCAYLGS